MPSLLTTTLSRAEAPFHISPTDAACLLQSCCLLRACPKLLVDLEKDGIDVPPEVKAEVVTKVQNIISKTVVVCVLI